MYAFLYKKGYFSYLHSQRLLDPLGKLLNSSDTNVRAKRTERES